MGFFFFESLQLINIYTIVSNHQILCRSHQPFDAPLVVCYQLFRTEMSSKHQWLFFFSTAFLCSLSSADETDAVIVCIFDHIASGLWFHSAETTEQNVVCAFMPAHFLLLSKWVLRKRLCVCLSCHPLTPSSRRRDHPALWKTGSFSIIILYG